MDDRLSEGFGPIYDIDGPALRKLRRGSDRKAHGAAVLKAVQAAQRGSLMRVTSSHAIHCASRSNHTTGAAILKAVASQHTAAIQACPGQIRRARTPEQWKEMYQAAMAEKGKHRGDTADQPAERHDAGRPSEGLRHSQEGGRRGHTSPVRRLAARPGLPERRHQESDARAR